MKKLFISQPMVDKTKKQIQVERNMAYINTMKKIGEEVELIDSFISKDPPKDLKGDKISLWYLGKALTKLAKADIAYFCKGWQKYRGCRLEYTAALEYGLKIITYDHL